MKPENFCYWLQGKFELDSSDILTPEQVRIIKAHLNLVFFHAIDPETLKDSSEVEKLKYQKIHDGAKSGEIITTDEFHELIKSIQPQDWSKAHFYDDSRITYNC